MKALKGVFGGKVPAAVYLDEEVLAKAGLSSANAPAESLGTHSLTFLCFNSRLILPPF